MDHALSLRAARRLAPAWLVLALAGCATEPDVPAPPADLASVDAAFDECLRGDVEAGLADLDAVVDQAPDDPGALVARGLCRWTRWSASADRADARQAYTDLSDAIDAVEAGAPSPGTSLDQIYSHRAFVAQSLDDGWTRTLEDLDHAVALAPGVSVHVLDRGVVHAYAGDTTAARADLRRFLALADSADADPAGADPADADRQRVVRALLDDLEPPPGR